MNNNALWKKVIDILTITILSFGVIVGYKAYKEYRNQNNAQMINMLISSDTEVAKLMIDNKHLQGLHVLIPKDQNPKSIANQILETIVDDKNDNTCHDWNYIPELYDNIFGLNNFNDENKKKLRDAYLIAEIILNDILSAFEAKNYNLINEKDYETYAGNFAEIGENPLFLCVIYWRHRVGYITKSFAQELKQRLLANPKRKHSIAVLYPDLLKDDWVGRVGEMK